MASSDKNVFGNIDPCPKHSMPSALSSTILDYYHRYGRNRDLERYLRFRNRSSSGSSIQLSPTNDSRVGKSLENINILESCVESEKSLQKSKSSESINRSGRSKPELTTGQCENSADTSDNQIKLTTKKALKSKKKFNINMDTHIEITLPQQLPHSSHQQVEQQQPSFDALMHHDFSQQKSEFETSQTQTERIEFPKTPNRSEVDAIDVPARPSSVASSAASISNKQRLEWDSMADVGYYKSTDNQLTNLTEFERKALKKFFNSHGLNFDEEILVFAGKAKLSNSVPELTKRTEKARIREKWEAAFQKILEEKYAKRNAKNKEGKVDPKRLWQSALVKFREKYGTQFNPESDLCITEPTVHSTPILSDSSKGAIPKVRSILLDTIKTESSTEKEPSEHVEKACQTSMVITSSKECQVDETTSDMLSVSDHQLGVTSTDNSKESEKSTDYKGGMVSAASFEFVAPAAYKGQDKENIPPRKKEIIFPPNEGRQDENKENVPPRQLNDNEIIDKFQLSTPPKTTTTTTDSSRTDEIFGVISTLENDLARGVEVLYSLASAKELNEEKKKKLVRKIIKRITTAKYKDSTASSESIVSSIQGYDSETSKSVVGNPHSRPNISGVNTLSSTSSSNSNKELSVSSAKVAQPVKQDNSKENSIKDFLKPITNSEVEYERNRSKEKRGIEQLPETESERQLRKKSIHSDVSQCDPNILKFVEQQRQSQFEWIDREICHLVNLKEFLQKKRESDIMKDIINLEMNRKGTSLSRGTDKSQESSGVIYENVTVDPKSTEPSYADVHGISQEALASRSNSNKSALKPTPKENQHQSHEKDEISNASSSLEWNSHINMQQFVRNRTKLQTPNDDIVSYAQTKEREFLGKYEGIRSRPIYTQPYSSDHSDHYSEPHDINRKPLAKKNTNHAYTSITGSDGFLSSDSVSIPVANSTSNTTTHQYDTRASVAIQTSSSLARTAPIFKVKSDSCNCGSTTCNCVHTRRPTVRVKYQTNDKQLQVIPAAICYDINFDEKKRQADANIKTDSNRTKTENYYRHSDSSSASSKDSKKKSEPNFVGNFGGCAKLSLQDHLKSARPDFVSQADERRKCVIELHSLREKRNEQRNRLFLLSSNQSLRNHIKTLNPPPIAGKRIFTTKALKQQTRNRYNKLPEIVSKEANERKNRIKRSNRIVRDMFNKNLQKRVLKGQTDLSNSVFVAAI
ncbi:uncharacterized protein LOC119072254 [Bradysia coprophila]|uniref:uncharacterized protein LOC119072254 n=1 Tax=Bradysia coprophila TaxID=38358 RepID=UPI00187DB857|nr:uncharacterized protein LOC119072254 [Bradysia coprophila]